MQTDTATLPLAAAWNGVHNVLSYSFSRETSSECALKWINTYQWPEFLQNIFLTEKNKYRIGKVHNFVNIANLHTISM